MTAPGRKEEVTTFLPSGLTSTSDAVPRGTARVGSCGKVTAVQPFGGETGAISDGTPPTTQAVCVSLPDAGLREKVVSVPWILGVGLAPGSRVKVVT